MEIEFDPTKDLLNQRSHGISIAAAGLLDWSAAKISIDVRKDYNETRYIAYAPLDDRLYCLVFTMRGDVMRAISLRKANSKEVRYYDET
jgi:uncharacterized DUF497 family protein